MASCRVRRGPAPSANGGAGPTHSTEAGQAAARKRIAPTRSSMVTTGMP